MKNFASKNVDILFLAFVGIALTVICALTLKLVLNDKNKSPFDEINAVKKVLLESKVVLKKDTLDIINTNFFMQTMTLENGMFYDYEYLSNKFLHPKVTLKRLDSITNKYK
tara:strand:+ start:816 stop:1148 length:333 start_codon:yes stop_codon:yes gene_type:complete